MSETNQNKTGLSLTDDQAIAMATAALSVGALKLPFLAQCNTQYFDQKVHDRAIRCEAGGLAFNEAAQQADADVLANTFALAARRDALVLLMFIKTLEHGVSKEEAERLIGAIGQ